ncbi:MAG: hypothetical protein ACJA2S_004808 [Cyclobacteriaceae bacterium]|jgi:hypothetical protein
MISHPHKCIFIHIPKTAGQSIENYFLQQLGLNQKQGLPLLIGRNMKDGIGPPEITHLTSEELLNYHFINSDLYHSYYKFAFVRNPYKRAYSLYRCMYYDRIMSFDEYARTKLSRQLWKDQHWFVRPQRDFIIDSNNESMMDFTGKFENLTNDFKKVIKAIGSPNNELIHTNKPVDTISPIRLKWLSRNDKDFWKVLLGASFRTYQGNCISSKEILMDLYSIDFETFDYSTEII